MRGQGAGFTIWGLGWKGWGFRVWGILASGFRVEGLGGLEDVVYTGALNSWVGTHYTFSQLLNPITIIMYVYFLKP